ncbi:hypothetical protein QB910_000002 [Dabrowskivirus KKP3916]|uniref:Replication initiation protein n=1 Tax=Alicyclobacillus phage KKP_3916 TaxID=3040651 RepID=A0AAT9V859_9CAUD|nr:hypothetical protein QB910_000002 [Alicyclobacillus phage KKP 3916]
MKPSELVNYRNGEGRIYIPNEIFEDLKKIIDKGVNIAFAYSYYYLITYLYRYSKYVEKRFTQPLLKELLGFSPTNKKIDYIIKKDGVLDTIGYTRTVKDYPVSYHLDDDKIPNFTLLSEWKVSHPEYAITQPEERNFRIKYPVKAFYRNEMAEYNDYFNGTFFEARNTHGIEIKTFLDMMDSDTEHELKCIGFYLYGFLCSRIGQYGGDWTAISKQQLVIDTRLSNWTIDTYIRRLQKRGFITVTHQDFFNNPAKLANVYEIKR